MIVVSIKLHSAVSKDNDRPLGVMVIANDNTGTKTVGNYTYALTKGRSKSKTGRVVGYRRKSDPVFKLIAMCLKDAGYIK